MLNVTWNGFRYTKEKVNEKTENEDGIYILAYKAEDGKSFAFYVGQGDIKTRLLHHLSDDEENPCVKKTVKNKTCSFWFAYLEKESDREGAERYLYDFYNRVATLCNMKVPEADSIEINTP